jgi:hypothetical protein
MGPATVFLLAYSCGLGIAAESGLGGWRSATPEPASPLVPRTIGKRLLGAWQTGSSAKPAKPPAIDAVESLSEMIESGIKSMSRKAAMIALSHVSIMCLKTIIHALQRPGQFVELIGGARERRRAAAAEAPTTLADVVGCDEAVRELGEVLDILKDPERYERVGAKLPKGVLLSGPPGTGKTLLAKACAGEAGGAFLAASGAQFNGMLVGQGVERVKALFAAARAHPSGRAIIFIDEVPPPVRVCLVRYDFVNKNTHAECSVK